MGKRELAALLCLSSWCLVIVVWLFLTMPRVCLQFVIVVFPDHTHLLFMLEGYEELYHIPRIVSSISKAGISQYLFYRDNYKKAILHHL